MNRLRCTLCGRIWYSSKPDLSKPCKCGGQLVDTGPADMLADAGHRRAENSTTTTSIGFCIIIAAVVGLMVWLIATTFG